MSAPPLMLSVMFCNRELLAAIGSIAAESTYLEQTVEDAITRLSGLPSDGVSCIMPTMIGGKLDLLLHLGKARLRTKSRRQQFSDLMSHIKNSNTERILAVHGVWEPQNDSGQHPGIINALRYPTTFKMVATKAAKGAKGSAKLDEDRAWKVAMAIAEGHGKLRDFTQEAWPRKFLEPLAKSVQRLRDHQQRGTRKAATPPDTPR